MAGSATGLWMNAHVSPREAQPGYGPREVVAAGDAVRGHGGVPAPHCGVVGRGQWRCHEAHNVYHVLAHWSGHLSRTETTFDFALGGSAPACVEARPGAVGRGDRRAPDAAGIRREAAGAAATPAARAAGLTHSGSKGGAVVGSATAL